MTTTDLDRRHAELAHSRYEDELRNAVDLARMFRDALLRCARRSEAAGLPRDADAIRSIERTVRDSAMDTESFYVVAQQGPPEEEGDEPAPF